ncbi:M48 family metalloprotease [Pseudoalteromonas rubra]|uniref:Putative beta-barrel assembly-enhancing protease n=1 Tax=Pseudoalteromonas rubra TaxID=43658 RepID=A0A4Q7E400_9GAMM|nr:M48 family metalloprotease [Pseudoalteromonas rubra]RZM76413.1 protease [Pseudoalteromonas rubra]
MQLRKLFQASVCALALSVSMPGLAQPAFKLPDLGTSAVQVLPIDKEKAIGEIMMMQIRSGSKLVQDPVLDEYLSTLGNKLVANANDVRFPFSFFWIDNKDINAFAFYGGHVGVHTGLMAQADNESQFASVLGHEIAHVTQRHLARRIQQARDNSALTIAGMITGILATVIAPDAGMAILSASSTQSALSQLTHSRKAEQEADRFGMQTLYNAGFDPHASSEFLSKLAAQVRFKNKAPVFLMSHPLPDSRVSDVRLRAQQYEQRYVPKSHQFQLAKSRVIARYQLEGESAQAYFEQALKHSSDLDKSALEYGLAITYLDQKKLDQAQAVMDKLLNAEPNNLFYLDVYTDLLLAKKDYNRITKLLGEKHQLRPNNQVITLNYANVALKSEQYELAEQLLKVFLLEKPDHVLARQLLTETYKKMDAKANYHESQASLLSHYGAFMRAADEIQKALNHVEKDETVRRLRLKALLTQYRDMQKELAKL